MPESNLCVMVVSGDARVRESARKAAKIEGVEAVLCGDGEEALESLGSPEKCRIRLLVLETYLPKIEGFDLANRLQEFPHTKEVPILMLLDRSPRPRAEERRPSWRLSADAYLQKPFEPEELRAEMHGMVKRFRAHGAPHPVTGLAGHPQMEQEVLNWLARGESFALLALDINHFRPYNDHFGLERGNEALRMVAALIQESFPLLETRNEPPLLAHIDGDDFLLLLKPGEADAVRRRLREEFKKRIQKFYPEAERKKGLFFGKDRKLKDAVFPLMDLSTAVVPVKVETFLHYGELIAQANDFLRQAKIGAQDVR